MKPDKLLLIAWSIAGVEARNLGTLEIQPIHFLLAALKIIDPGFPAQLENLDIPTEEWRVLCRDAKLLSEYIDIIPNKITEVRRRIRNRLARCANPPIIDEKIQVHRSRKTRAAFFGRASQ